MRRSIGFKAAVLCFFFSGAASLMLEIVWTRLLRLVFGSTTLAVSTILVAYMLGLGLGGLLGARFARRFQNGVRTYGQVEIAAGAYAAAVPLLLTLMPGVNDALLSSLSFWPAAVARFFAVLAVLLLPTILMGTTLPIVVAALVRQTPEVASRVGLLYGVNTLGAVTGVVTATFFLLPTIGVARTNLTGALLDVGVGLLALLVVAPLAATAEPTTSSTPAPEKTPAAEPPASPRKNRGRQLEAEVAANTATSDARLALLAYAVVGFTALTYEVCWSRALSMILGSSIYAFATMLAAFLTGISAGSLIARRWFDRLRRPLLIYAAGIGLVGLLSLATMAAFSSLPALFVELLLRLGSSAWGVSATRILVAMLAMLPPTLVLGALFPLLIRVLADAGMDASEGAGRSYFANTLGSSAGAFAAGFVLIPGIGLHGTMAAAVSANFAAAGLLLLAQQQAGGLPRFAGAAAALAFAAFVLYSPPRWSPEQLSRGVFNDPDSEIDVGLKTEPLNGVPADGLLYYREGINTTISVHRVGANIAFRVNGKTDAGTSRDMDTQVLLGHIPLLFGGPGERVLIIGLASGVSVGSVVLHGAKQIDVVELEPAVVEASHFFDPFNHRPLDHPNVRVIADDGRNYLEHTSERYDVIISEPSNPWISGAASLFTREFFTATKRCLRPGGRLMQWAELYGLRPDGLRSIVAALRSVFPHVYGLSRGDRTADLLLLATQEPLRQSDLPVWENLNDGVRQDLARVEIYSTADLWALIQLTDADIESMVASAEVLNSDDNLFVETNSPWSFYTDNTEANTAMLQSYQHGVLPLLEADGRKAGAAEVGAMALSYLMTHENSALAEKYVDQAMARGNSADATLAEIGLRRGDEDNATERLNAALELDPAAGGARLRRARLLLAKKDDAGALADADTLLATGAADPRARALRMKALAQLGRLQEANAEAEVLLNSSYTRVDPHLWLEAAQIDASLGDLDGAVRRTQRYLEAQPGDPRGWLTLALYYKSMSKQSLAEDAARNTKRALRNQAIEAHADALRFERLGQIDQARAAMREAVQIDPKYEEGRAELQRLAPSGG